jgi:hypothetical protein
MDEPKLLAFKLPAQGMDTSDVAAGPVEARHETESLSF